MAQTDDVLDVGSRCVLACRGPHGLSVAGSAFWSDGAGVWLALPADSAVVAGLRRDGACGIVVLPPAPGVSGDVPGAVIHGVARVHGLHDPVGLVVHAPTVAAAMAALAARNAATVAGAIQDVSRDPARRQPRNVVAVRVTVRRRRSADWPVAPGNIAPALPAVLPAALRRGAAGRRDVVLATAGPAAVEVGPATWGAGFALAVPPGRLLQPGADAAAVVEGLRLSRDRGTGGLAVLGSLAPGPVLRPREALWWQGFEQARADVPPAGVTLPD